jgi:conjugative transfer signal peptidase TraF
MCADPIRPRTRILVVAMLFLAAAAVAIPISERHPLLLYNASGSAPIGLYRIENRSPECGETAVVRPSPTLENLLATHRLLPPGVPLLKRVIGLGGDHICRSEGVIFVNGKAFAETLDRDAEGRSLPAWKGCFTLFPGQFFLLQPHPYSFDSRYFGPVSESEIIGVAHPLWTWNPSE